MSSTANNQFSAGKVVSSLLSLLAFVVLAGIGIKTIPTKPGVGWFATILFGTMSVVAIVEIVRNCSLDQDQPVDVKAQLNIRRALVIIGTAIVTIFLGVTDELIGGSFNDSFPRPGVWFAAFLSNLAFYPLREKKNVSDFSLWVYYCALMAVASVVISYLKDWLEALLL